MNYYTISAGPLLADYVRYFWVLEGDPSCDGPGDGTYTHRSMACGCPELCFHYQGTFVELLEGDKTEKSFLTGINGQSQYFRRFRTSETFGLFGAFLYPFAVPLLLGIPAATISNLMVDLTSLLGKTGDMLSEKMMVAKDNKERSRILADFLESRLNAAGSSRVIPAIRQIVHTKGLLPIHSLTDQFFLSKRQFERAFSQYAGFTPKLFSRLLRFETALGAYNHTGKSLTEIAYDCGYYDQSHFIHEFKEFSGHHPRHYFSGNAEGTGWRDC
ncbi:helix-turn-helix domain-containing protein [Flavitalea flava]